MFFKGQMRGFYKNIKKIMFLSKNKQILIKIGGIVILTFKIFTEKLYSK